MDYTPKEIVYNVPHPSIQLHLQDGEIKKTLILFIQEIKRDIMYRRMNILEGHRNRQMPLVRIHFHSGLKDDTYSSTLKLVIQNDSLSEVRMTAGTYIVR